MKYWKRTIRAFRIRLRSSLPADILKTAARETMPAEASDLFPGLFPCIRPAEYQGYEASVSREGHVI